MFIRPALRKMQGFTAFDRPRVKARLKSDRKKKDSRRLLLRASLMEDDEGCLIAAPAKNQNSGLFSTIQRGNCLAVLPEGVPEGGRVLAGTEVDCILLDVEEGTILE